MKKIVLLFLGFLVFFPIQPSFASSDFTSSFDVTYSVRENGLAHAVFVGRLTNTTNTKYASVYTLQVGFHDKENITASENNIQLAPKVVGSSIQVKFPVHVVGKGQSINFSIAFDTKDIAKHNGNIWEVNIPGIANQEDFSDFTVHLNVPNSFGAPSYIKPVSAGSSLDFDKTTLGSSGISIAFGKSQSYNFSLTYHLSNTSFFPTQTEIALPSNTNYQDVSIQRISPRPQNVVIDKDGNWLAQYTLLPSQNVTVVVNEQVTVFLNPKEQRLSAEDRHIYLTEQPFWQTSNKEITELANDLKTPEEILQYVVNHLSYDFSRVAGTQSRVGAEGVLQKPTSAVCLEFTDLFIALSRAAGIPAREVDGYAFTQNQQERPLSSVTDILHSWPEYYDDALHTWVMVDPTWENTTKGTDYFSVLDFDHVAFVIRGVSSTLPIPAGGYKSSSQQETKDITMAFGNEIDNTQQKAGIDFSIARSFLSGFPLSGSLFVRSASSELIPSQKIYITSQGLTPTSQTVYTPPIPPFGYAVQTISFNKTSFLTNDTKRITIQLAGNTISKSIRIYSIFSQKSFIIGGIIFVIFCIIIFVVAARSRRVSVS